MEVHHAFADCSKVKEFWSRIHCIAKKLKIEPRQNNLIPEKWHRISGIRDYNLRGEIEERWQIIHSVALQSINNKFWKYKIDGSAYDSHILWGDFTNRLKHNIQRSFAVAKRQDSSRYVKMLRKKWKIREDDLSPDLDELKRVWHIPNLIDFNGDKYITFKKDLFDRI